MDMTKAFGAEIAREQVIHNPNTRALERYYLNTMSIVNVAAIRCGEVHPLSRKR